MIIISQDKDLIVNFDNVEAIILGNPIKDEHGFCKIIALVTSNNNCTLGKYTTEERAKEVLQEIVQVYVNSKKANEGNTLFGGFQWIPADTLYTMPKE